MGSGPPVPQTTYITNCLVVGRSEVWVFGDAHVGPGIDVWGLGEDRFLHPVVARWNGHSWVRNTQLTRALGKTPPSGAGITALSGSDWSSQTSESLKAPQTL